MLPPKNLNITFPLREHMNIYEALNLTKGEKNVYKALVKLRSSTTGPIYKQANVSQSKVYEILDRFMILGIQKAKVTTNDNPFFVPAQRMYKSSGFHEIFREPWERDRAQSLIHYQKRIG